MVSEQWGGMGTGNEDEQVETIVPIKRKQAQLNWLQELGTG